MERWQTGEPSGAAVKKVHHEHEQGEAKLMKPAHTHHTKFVATVHVQGPQTLALRVGRSVMGLTAPQARRLASMLLVHAEVLLP